MQKIIKTSWPGIIPLFLIGFGTSTASALSANTELGSKDLIGVLDFDLAYGVRWRLEDRAPELIGKGNGGESINANFDNGTLNYDQGKPVSNMVRGAGELTLIWGNFGAYVRAYAFYDFENERHERARTELSNEAKEQVGSNVLLQDAYLSARFEVNTMPLQFRLGQQVVNWGESRFFPNSGVNVANPLNLPLVQQPMGLPRDLRKPVGTLWGSLQFNPSLAVEAYYQYEWHETILPAEGTYFSASDPIGPGGDYAQSGPFPDQGTNVDAAFGLPPGTVGFVSNWFHIPRGSDITPSDQGQFGISLQLLTSKLNDAKFAISFANYHSKVPFLGAIAPPLEDFLAYSVQAIEAQTNNLINAGTDPENAARAAGSIQLNQFLNGTRYLAEYPENIQVLGLSFNTTSLRTGTAFFGEVSHHFDAPMPIFPNQALDQALPGATPESPFPPVDLEQTSPEEIAASYANQPVDFIENLDKTFLALGATQLFGPRLGAAQTALTAEIGWLYVWDFPAKDELLFAAPGLTVSQTGPTSAFADDNSWGYRLLGSLTYNSVFGAVTLRPRFGFTHDVNGNSPSGAGSFREGKKSLSLGLTAEYIQRVRADISYVGSWGADQYNTLSDRDNINFNIRYFF